MRFWCCRYAMKPKGLFNAVERQYMIAYSCILFNQTERTRQAKEKASRAQNKNKNITIMTQH